ncbi:MAG: hypothetical protein ACT4PS_00105 [Betaproteobacteria bacterium]
MSNVTTQQLAELLLGIARAQNAIIEAMENSKAGFKATHFRPTLETVSRIRSNREESLVDYPARLLLQLLGRTGPDLQQVVADLEALVGGTPRPAAAPEAAGYAPGVEAGSLNLTQT